MSQQLEMRGLQRFFQKLIIIQAAHVVLSLSLATELGGSI